jgi:hypothetical protein
LTLRFHFSFAISFRFHFHFAFAICPPLPAARRASALAMRGAPPCVAFSPLIFIFFHDAQRDGAMIFLRFAMPPFHADISIAATPPTPPLFSSAMPMPCRFFFFRHIFDFHDAFAAALSYAFMRDARARCASARERGVARYERAERCCAISPPTLSLYDACAIAIDAITPFRYCHGFQPRFD